MKRNFLKALAICLGIFLVIDSVSYIFFDFECIDALLKLIGVKSIISVILRWIIIVAAVAVEILIGRYEKKSNKKACNEAQS